MLVISPTLPNVNDVRHLVAVQSSVILDRNGEELYTIHGDENRDSVPLDQISPYAAEAVMAIEDDRFYEHFGIDISGILAAVCGEMGVCQKRGGSTITQQFVKNAFLSSERTYIRKVKEIALALQLERRFTKDEILEMYLNRIPYGANIYGVELASRTFFGKPAKELTILEAAILGAIPKAPTFYSPYGDNQHAKINLNEEEILRMDIRSEQDLVDYSPRFINKGLLGKTYIFGRKINEDGMVMEAGRSIYVKGRVDFVLERMRELDYITEDQQAQALAEAETKEFKEFREAIVAPHFVMYVRQLLEDKYGKEAVEKGGLKVTTTLDVALQKAAEAAVEHYVADDVARYGANNQALISVDPDNGQIMAMVGSRDYWNDEIDGKVNIIFRPRLPGSSFKPFVYAAAFLQGYAPATVLYDVDTKFGEWYQPQNFDGKFEGPISMRTALGHSRNVPAVKAGYLAGIPNVLSLARRMGIQLDQPDDWYGLSLAIGAGEARPIDMALAYSAFANGGYRLEPIAILKVEDRNGNLLEEYETPETREQILDPQVAYLINNVLSDREANPAGFWRERLRIPGQINGAKTGTSNKQVENPHYNPNNPDSKPTINIPFDGWTIGYTRYLVTAVWAGNNDGTPMKPKASGLDAAGGIWHDFMVTAHAGKPAVEFEKPEGIRYVQVSKRSGKLPSEYTPPDEIITEVFASFSVPTQTDDSYQVVEIDKVSGKLATEYTPAPAREMKAFFTHHSILPDHPDWEDAVRKWAEENNQDEAPPTEYDDVHTPGSSDVKPEIRILSPTANGFISPPSVGVVTEINSPGGVTQVDFYFDDELVQSVTKPPYRGLIPIPPSAADDSAHTLRAVVFDKLYRSSQAAVEARIGKDALPPHVRFLYPQEDDFVAAGSYLATQIDAYDSNGDVKKLEFYLDGTLLNTFDAVPYVWQFFAPDTPGPHSLKAVAYDYADNRAETQIALDLSASPPPSSETGVRLVQPAANQSYDHGEPLVIKVAVGADVSTDLKGVTVFAKPEKDRVIEIAGVSGNAPSYTFIWGEAVTGRYELYLKISLKDGSVRFSDRVPIVIR